MESKLLETLYRSYARELMLYLYSLCHSRELAEDLLQEVFLKALLSLDENHPNFRAWLYQVGKNICLNQMKKQKHKALLEDDIPDSDSPLDLLLQQEKNRALFKALFTLSPLYREILTLQYFSGLSQDVPEQFTKMVKQSIHRAFWKLGCCVLMAVLAVTLFIQCGLSPIMDAFYYDPEKMVGEFTNQMSLDMAVYTDIRIPLGKRDSVNAVPLGYGRYNVTFPTSVYFSYIERPATVAGEISRNKLTLYDADAFRKPSVNIFARYDSQWVTTPDYALELIKGLEENQYYTAWLSFEEDISYTEFLEFEEKADIFYSWIPIRTDDSSYFPNGHMGLSSSFGGACLEGWDDEKYPYLFLSGSAADVDIDTQLAAEKDEAIITRHFLSRLRYLADSKQETFLSFFNERSRTFSSAYDYVAEHGLSNYGCVFYGTKEQLLEISGMENVYGIYVQR